VGEKLCADTPLPGLSRREKTILCVGEAVERREIGLLVYVRHFYSAATTGTTYGAYLTTDQLGFAYGNLTATLTGNTLSHFNTGMFVTQTNPTPGQEAGGQATITASPNNSFLANGTGANGEPGTTVNAANDWWGCTKGPNMGGACNTALGTVTYTPWLTAKP